MEKGGHYGAALFVSAIFVVWLGLIYGLSATALMMLFTQVPDLDQYIPENLIRHREETHSLSFAAIVAFVTASTAAYPLHAVQQLGIKYLPLQSQLVSPSTVWLFLAATVMASLIVHILVDAITTGGGYKIQPLWPFNSKRVALGYCNSNDKVWNASLMASGATAFACAILHELYYGVLPLVVQVT